MNKLSKLVKKVKLDLDQRMFKKCLEHIVKTIGTRDNPGIKGDNNWKHSWRLLLPRMLSLFDRLFDSDNDDRQNKSMSARMAIAEGIFKR